MQHFNFSRYQGDVTCHNSAGVSVRKQFQLAKAPTRFCSLYSIAGVSHDDAYEHSSFITEKPIFFLISRIVPSITSVRVWVCMWVGEWVGEKTEDASYPVNRIMYACIVCG